MRIDELELRQRARVVLEFLHLKQAEPVVRERRAGVAEREANGERRDAQRKGANCHERFLQLCGLPTIVITIPRAGWHGGRKGLESCIREAREISHISHKEERNVWVFQNWFSSLPRFWVSAFPQRKLRSTMSLPSRKRRRTVQPSPGEIFAVS